MSEISASQSWRYLGIGTATISFLGILVVLPVQAEQLSDGRVIFDTPPRLVDSGTRTHSANLGGKYRFTIELPATAGEPLEAVVITPRTEPSQVSFVQGESSAFLGEGLMARNQSELSLADIGGPTPEHPDEVQLVFDEPVAPGNTVTVSVQSMINPHLGGVQLFGVTAYPAGENGVGQFLGYGRITTYDN